MAEQTYEQVAGLQVAQVLYRFVEDEALPGSGVEPAKFWQGLSDLVNELGPRNAALLARREDLQRTIDGWHRDHPGAGFDPAEYRAFLEEIEYLEPEGPDFLVDTEGVDTEIAEVAGPQLVVPVDNARYALNAANARWGSLYDAVYGTDVMGDSPPDGPYDPVRGDRVIAWVRALLDDVMPLASGSHADAEAYAVVGGHVEATLESGARARGWRCPISSPATAATRPPPRPCCCARTGSTSSCRSTASTRSARSTRPASPT